MRFDAWVQIVSDLQKDIFISLQKMLDYVNPYAKLYHGTWDYLQLNPTADVKLILWSSGSGIDPRRYLVEMWKWSFLQIMMNAH